MLQEFTRAIDTWGEFGLAGLVILGLLTIIGWAAWQLVGPKGILRVLVAKMIQQNEERNAADAAWQRKHKNCMEEHDKKLEEHNKMNEVGFTSVIRRQRGLYIYQRDLALGACDVLGYAFANAGDDTKRAIATLREKANQMLDSDGAQVLIGKDSRPTDGAMRSTKPNQ